MKCTEAMIARTERVFGLKPDRLMADACALAEKFAAVDRQAMAATKALFYRVFDLPFAQALEEGRDVNKRMRAFRKP